MSSTEPARIRVAHVSSAHRTSDVRIHLREAASLSENGFDVTLVAVGHEIELPNTGVRLVSLRARRRFSRVTLGSIAAVRAALRTRAQIVHLHDPELVWAILPLRLLGRRVVYDAHEDLPSQMLSKSYLPVPARPVVGKFARVVVRAAAMSDHVVAATEKIAASFPPEKVSVVRNYPRLRHNDDDALAIDERPFLVAYLGVMSEERGVRHLIEALDLDEFPDHWRAVVAGPPSPATFLGDMSRHPGWGRVDYKGFLSTDGARDLLLECRVGICALQRTEAYVDSLPTKMFEYFAAGMPVVASDFPLWRSIIEEHDCGLLIDETSPDAIAGAVARYAREPELLRRHSANALSAAQGRLNWENEEHSLLQAYARITPPTSRIV